MKKRLLSTLIVAGLTTTNLAGCVAPIVMGGAFVSGVLVASDRRTTGTQVEDQGIELRAFNRLGEALGSQPHINVVSYNRQVLLTGEVPTEADREKAENIVSKIDNVRSVINELAVLGNSSLSSRTADTVITSRVKTALMDSKEISGTAFKIVTERGVVYMMGRVTQREANIATEIARRQSGVQKVVRVFDLISEEELKRIMPPPAPQAEMTSTPVMSGSGTPVNTQAPKY